MSLPIIIMVGPTAAITAAKYFFAHRWLFQLSLTPPEIAAAKTRAIVILTPGHVDCFYSSIISFIFWVLRQRNIAMAVLIASSSGDNPIGRISLSTLCVIRPHETWLCRLSFHYVLLCSSLISRRVNDNE